MGMYWDVRRLIRKVLASKHPPEVAKLVELLNSLELVVALMEYAVSTCMNGKSVDVDCVVRRVEQIEAAKKGLN